MLEGVGAFQAEAVARVLDYGALHAEADAEEGHAVLARPLDGCDLTFDPALAESLYIMVAMYQIAMLSIIALGIMAMGVNANAQAFIQCVASVVGSMGVVILIMWPKIVRRNKDSNELMAAASKTASSTHYTTSSK